MIFTKFIPGGKFKVRDDFPIKTSGLLHNSIGFVAYAAHMFNTSPKVVPICGKVQLVLIRKGKKGKPRIERVSVTTPIFYEESLAKNHEKCYKNIYGNNQVLEVEPTIKNILSLDHVNFIAWSYAYRSYILKLFQFSNFKLKKLPAKEKDPFNIIQEISLQFNDFPHEAMERVHSDMRRIQIVDRLRYFEGILAKDITSRLLASVQVTEHYLSRLMSLYKGADVPERYLKEAQAIKHLIKRDGADAVITHLYRGK